MGTLNILIRPYDAATDLKRLSDIWFDASMAAHPFIGEARLVEQRQLIEEDYLPTAETWVACHEREAVGFISLLGSFIGGLFVAPDRQGMGVGRKLVSHALARHGELSLEVYTANEQAVRFYSSLGFRELSRRDVDDFGFPFPNASLHLKV
ncbi:GNAT family N-acetyltransferase [Rhodobacter sphaeroides]|mgnify:CR=1 FL=1|jgi:Acetyltransferases|uniref:Acetyltransferase n=1 Tax=Cereibacter sphaeroides (strain ATCC 17023 / DSM 158 / JCM 6121 / CCUG 31486 / LMG 2827 / NBRC 12203 / NCIMB 8253 / ATH 2.4.1.) TaxID=272943 RepID=Q3J4U5_CERS4|nr:GNAT family N-acetyltransferase [Cereibacter sphaeroides]ABA78189.1 putative acetyltransferase [Cereibacter sphaeroides 2.4.1]AMJ46558.1 acetyltransferase [Cereibacter sphaeroides]ANS33270.1 acetyltransferase [Cereibacter sphaeroides]ATN62314.1 acetyltransferase [Cereibacter sphaeroides]AXC60417.1 GNAT family N-acetyltransferase [Cereibacter sphaeroides 2.4.1]